MVKGCYNDRLFIQGYIRLSVFDLLSVYKGVNIMFELLEDRMCKSGKVKVKYVKYLDKLNKEPNEGLFMMSKNQKIVVLSKAEVERLKKCHT